MGLLFSSVVPLVISAVAFLFPFAAFAQSSPCDTTQLTSLVPCLAYVSSGNTTNPANDCCTPLRALVGNQPACLCQLEPLANQFAVSINETRGYEVATLCKLNVSACLLGITAPAQSPSASSTTGGGSGSGRVQPPKSFAAGALAPSAFVAVVLTGLICSLFSL